MRQHEEFRAAGRPVREGFAIVAETSELMAQPYDVPQRMRIMSHGQEAAVPQPLVDARLAAGFFHTR